MATLFFIPGIGISWAPKFIGVFFDFKVSL